MTRHKNAVGDADGLVLIRRRTNEQDGRLRTTQRPHFDRIRLILAVFRPDTPEKNHIFQPP